MSDPIQTAAWIDQARREGRLFEARDALHAALPYAPRDPNLCYAGGELYTTLGFAREAIRFYEVVERSGHPGLAADATTKITRLASEGTVGSKDVAVCVLSLLEVYRAFMTEYARSWPYAHWETACLADPCWVLNPTHLAGPVSGGHAAPPPHARAWWTILYAIEALDPTALNASLGGRFAAGDMLVFLQTSATTLPLEGASERDRLGITTMRKVTAIEQVSPPIDMSQITRVYVAGRVDEPLLS
jgi:hypothetical protein